MLFFDLDGPILDVSERYYQVYRECLKNIEDVSLSKDDYWRKKQQKIPETEILNRNIGISAVNVYIANRKKMIEDPIFLKYDQIWMDIIPTYKHLFHKIPAVLVTLRSSSKNLHHQLRTLNIYSWFYRILSHPNIDQSESRWKIKVELIQEAGLLHNISPEDCLFVGDTETDIMAGKILGMETAAVTFGIRTRSILLKYKPDQIFDTQLELSNFLKERYL